MKKHMIIVSIFVFFTTCRSLDIQTVQHAPFANDSIYIKDIHIHNEQYSNIKDSLVSHIAFHLQKNNLKAASYFNPVYREQDFKYTATVDIFISKTGDIFNQVENVSLFIFINDTATHVASIRIISQNSHLQDSFDQAMIAKAIAQEIDAMVVKK
ncbi:MAG: hypothetical protein AB1444_13220 [Spirochaetota bacterium]